MTRAEKRRLGIRQSFRLWLTPAGEMALTAAAMLACFLLVWFLAAVLP